MSTRAWRWPLALLASAQTAPVPPPDTLTLAEARTLSPDALARRLLGASAALVREAAVQEGDSTFDSPGRLAGVTFATAPHAGWPGLCTAELYRVTFAPMSANVADRAGPARVVDLTRDTVFRIVDAEPVPATGYSQDYVSRLTAACARHGPVITGPVTLSYFYSRYEGRPDSNGQAAQLVAGLMKRLDDPLPAMRCESRFPGVPGTPDDCRKRLAAFGAGLISDAQIKSCEPPSRYWCIDLRDNGRLDWTAVTVEIARPLDLSQPATIDAVTLREVHAVQ